jgi:hypothetical protein
VSNLAYLLIAVVLSGAGSAWLWWRNRQPSGLDAGIRQFERELRALAPEQRGRESGGRPSG